jgi:hypothetical protein
MSTPLVVTILPDHHGNPPGAVADAELHVSGGDLDGLTVVGRPPLMLASC